MEIAALRHLHRRIVAPHISNGYTLKEIADCLGIHYTVPGKIVYGTEKLILQDLTPFFLIDTIAASHGMFRNIKMVQTKNNIYYFRRKNDFITGKDYC